MLPKVDRSSEIQLKLNESRKWPSEKTRDFLKNLGFTNTQSDIIKALLIMKSNKELEIFFSLSSSTIKTHKATIYMKANVHDMGGLIVWLYQKGFEKE